MSRNRLGLRLGTWARRACCRDAAGGRGEEGRCDGEEEFHLIYRFALEHYEVCLSCAGTTRTLSTQEIFYC